MNCKSCGQPISEPKWLVFARSKIGLKERTGKNDHPTLDQWWTSFNVKWLLRQAWCGLFIAVAMRESGYKPPRFWYRAKSWLNFGVEIKDPVYGCIAVLERNGGGHVMFVVGMDMKGRLMGLGGNQSNAVNIQPFDKSRVIGYRVPQGYYGKALSTMIAEGNSSTNEA